MAWFKLNLSPPKGFALRLPGNLKPQQSFTDHEAGGQARAAPVYQAPEGTPPSLAGSGICQGQVRFFAYLRIKPHAPPLVRVPVYSFEF